MEAGAVVTAHISHEAMLDFSSLLLYVYVDIVQTLVAFR